MKSVGYCLEQIDGLGQFKTDCFSFQIAYENGISRQNSYLFISALHVMVIFSTFVLLPKTFIPKVEPDKNDLDEGEEAVKALNGNGTLGSQVF